MNLLRMLNLEKVLFSVGMMVFLNSAGLAATTLPVLWAAGGLTAGIDSKTGNAGQIASDTLGNVVVVSGPALGRNLAVTSYTASGVFRWNRTIAPEFGTFAGGGVVVAPDGDFVAVGYTLNSHGGIKGSTMVRYSTDGILRWRVEPMGYVSQMVVDKQGSVYLAVSGQDTQMLKYDSSGILKWSTAASRESILAANSLAVTPDGVDVVLTGNIINGLGWFTAAFDTNTGTKKWLTTAPEESMAATSLVVDATRIYVTGEGRVGIYGFLTVVAFDRVTGLRLWRTDANIDARGLRIALAPDGSVVVAGHTADGGSFNWMVVALDANGTVKWKTLRDLAVRGGDEIPSSIFVLADGTTVVSGIGGPATKDILGNSYLQGVTAGYSSTGVLLWEAFSKLGTSWATALPNGNVCATGGYDALITCWQVPEQQSHP
jgi:hypothetical protein